MSLHRAFKSNSTILIAAVLGLLSITAHAEKFDPSLLQPSKLFIQAGVADDNTQAYVAGVTWDWNWIKQWSGLTATGYFEADIGRWITNQGGVRGSAWATQVGLTPVVRFRPSGAARNWFGEIGIGANVILPIFRSEEKRFSTEFNFGDHLAVGRQFGKQGRQEIALRLQHFSNGGIDHPNPGENFVQLRYSHRL